VKPCCGCGGKNRENPLGLDSENMSVRAPKKQRGLNQSMI